MKLPSRTWNVRSVLLLVLGTSVLLAVPAACTSAAQADEARARWHAVQLASPSDRVLWQLMLLSLESQGYPLAAGTDSGARAVESGWKTDMQPFRGMGLRRRANLRLTPLEPGRWKLEARVKLEHNQNLVSPLDPTRAQWEPSPDDEPAAQILLMHVQARLRPELELTPPKKQPVPGEKPR